jgi:hypothetical protein
MFTALVHDERPTVPNAAMSRADRTPIMKGNLHANHACADTIRTFC